MAEVSLRLYDIKGNEVFGKKEIPKVKERIIQNLIESNMEKMFSTRLVAREYTITGGRMDSIGLDENFSPVIFEYKQGENENVVTQGLYYLDWLMDHKGDFTLDVKEKLGEEAAQKIDWSNPTLICVAQKFSKFDLHAIKQIDRIIKLVKYTFYTDGTLAIEDLNKVDSEEKKANKKSTSCQLEDLERNQDGKSRPLSQIEIYERADPKIKQLYAYLCDEIEEFGDDFDKYQLKYYLAYRKSQNFACVELLHSSIKVHLNLDPKEQPIETGFSKDNSNSGHRGTGNYQVTIVDEDTLDKALPFIKKAYEETE